MIIKASYARGRTAPGRTKANLRYISHRPAMAHDGPVTRPIFDGANDVLNRTAAYELLDNAEGAYHYRIIASAQGSTPADLRYVARELMDGLEARLHSDITWVAVEHRDHSFNDHVHIVAALDQRLKVSDLQFLREEATHAHEQQMSALVDRVSETYSHSLDEDREQEMER